MKNFLFTLIIALAGFQSFAQSQSQLNLDADAAYKKADIQLNKVYRDVLEKYAKDSKFIDKLKNAQRIWIMFRDAEVDLKYPPHQDYGSAYPMCVSLYLKGITEERIEKLKEWLNGGEEGDLCNGSVN
ncbi:Uncharacterized conserved protein YecT, DUF1311 family [Spirosomataceae bacterium TFI 002]|nr:Uncharacterized conserved protein YecT, DUF1311 family [Spirosomataceae bacterium TFI 002]